MNELISVPDLSVMELLDQLKRGQRLVLDPRYVSWNFLRDEGGKTYKPVVWSPRRYVTTAELFTRFSELGAEGNIPAFIRWVAENDPKGYWVSVPRDSGRYFVGTHDHFAPSFLRIGESRSLSLAGVRGRWYADESFVAFREIRS